MSLTEKIDSDAVRIAAMISNTPIELRHILYDAVSSHLSNKTQFHQSSYFKALAKFERGEK